MKLLGAELSSFDANVMGRVAWVIRHYVHTFADFGRQRRVESRA
jgi:hypothetical protein